YERRRDMLSRRDLVGRLAAGTPPGGGAGAAKASFAPSPPQAPARDGNREIPARGMAAPLPHPLDAGTPETWSAPAPWELLRPLAMGSVVANDWRVAGLTGAVAGSCVLTLENGCGRTHRVHICSNQGRPQGLVYTRRFDLVVMNGG